MIASLAAAPLGAAGGNTEDTTTNSPLAWSQLPALPDHEGFAAPFAGVSGGALIVAGGANFPGKKPWEGGTKVWYDKVFVLERNTNQWRVAGRLPRPLGYGVSVTTSNGVISAARKLGYMQPLEDAGVAVLEGVCFYILQNLSPMREKNGWQNMVSNSAKIVNIIGAHRFNTILRRTAECVEIACTGQLA